jgi:hypothetical protein
MAMLVPLKSQTWASKWLSLNGELYHGNNQLLFDEKDKTYLHDITEILSKMELSTYIPTYLRTKLIYKIISRNS